MCGIGTLRCCAYHPASTSFYAHMYVCVWGEGTAFSGQAYFTFCININDMNSTPLYSIYDGDGAPGLPLPQQL